MSHKKKPLWIKLLIVALAIFAAYFINVEIQTALGEKALAATGLEHKSLDEALASAKEQGKPVLADLSAIWCPTCRRLDKTIFSDEAVKDKIRETYIFARIEYESDAGAAFQQRYSVQSFPTLLVLSPTGEQLRELPITTDPNEFLSHL